MEKKDEEKKKEIWKDRKREKTKKIWKKKYWENEKVKNCRKGMKKKHFYRNKHVFSLHMAEINNELWILK